MNTNNGDYKKDNHLINRLNYINNKNETESITLNEEKLLEYFFFSLQERHIIRKEVKQDDFYWEEDNLGRFFRFKSNDKEYESIEFEIELYKLKKFMKIEYKNYIKEIKDILSRFSNRQINYIRQLENGTQEITILPIKRFLVEKLNGEKNYKVFVSLNVEFVYLALFRNGNQYTPLNINTVKNIRSKYA